MDLTSMVRAMMRFVRFSAPNVLALWPSTDDAAMVTLA
jgi:hypothetical protein